VLRDLLKRCSATALQEEECSELPYGQVRTPPVSHFLADDAHREWHDIQHIAGDGFSALFPMGGRANK
jgi:hypothetical protein